MPNSKRLLLLLALFAPMFAAIPTLTVWRVSTLGSDVNGGAWDPAGANLVSGTYTSGITATGTTGQTCYLSGLNGGGFVQNYITVALTGTNTIASSTALTITGSTGAFTSAPTSATAGSGTATCSGTAVISTTIGSGVDMSQYPSPNSSGCTAGTSCYSSTHNLSETTASTNGTTTITTHSASAYDNTLNGNVVYITGATTTGLASGTYTSGITTTGTTGQTCILEGFNNSGVQVLATVALTGTNTIAGSTALTVVYYGNGFTSAPTTATAYPGTATACSGTATISTALGNSAGWYRATYASSTTFTVDRNIPTGTSGNNLTVNIGGALADIYTPGMAVTAGNNICVKADGTYSITSTNVLQLAQNLNVPGILQGYTTTCGVNGASSDRGTATLLASQALSAMLLPAQSSVAIYNFVLNNGSYTGTTRGIYVNSASVGITVDNVLFENYATVGMASPASGAAAALVSNSRFTGGLSGCTAGFAAGNWAAGIVNSISDTNACTGFSGVQECYGCIAANNTGSSSDGFAFTPGNNPYIYVESAAYSNGRYGFNLGGNSVDTNVILRNSWAYGNTTKDITCSSNPCVQAATIDYNAYSTKLFFAGGPHDVVLTADPTVSGATLNFALNSTAGGGAALKAAGFPGALLAGGTGYISIGPLQPQASSSTATACPIGYGICP